jgi:3-oxoacyl-[acyl-carrier protein] reductase
LRAERKVALITGAARGLGAFVALEFARAGYRVTVNYLTSRILAERLARRLTRAGGDALCIRADVARSAEAEAMVAEVVSRWGWIDVLVNNAGVTHESLLLSTSEADWERVMGANLRGAFACSRAAARRMLARGSGHIISVSSLLGLRGARGEAVYAASKAALVGFTMSLAKELGPSGIRVNAVVPGFMPTPMTHGLAKEVRESARRESVLGRFANPVSVARFIVNLAGMKSVSGQLFNLDGRLHRWM